MAFVKSKKFVSLNTIKEISVLLLLFIFLFTFQVFAGEFFGTIREGNKPVSEGIRIDFKIKDERVGSTVTDKYGSYRQYIRESGRCTLTVYFGGQAPYIIAHSYNDPVRYDLLLIKKNDRYILRRE